MKLWGHELTFDYDLPNKYWLFSYRLPYILCFVCGEKHIYTTILYIICSRSWLRSNVCSAGAYRIRFRPIESEMRLSKFYHAVVKHVSESFFWLYWTTRLNHEWNTISTNCWLNDESAGKRVDKYHVAFNWFCRQYFIWNFIYSSRRWYLFLFPEDNSVQFSKVREKKNEKQKGRKTF